jgi:hypothetical protein
MQKLLFSNAMMILVNVLKKIIVINIYLLYFTTLFIIKIFFFNYKNRLIID